MPQLAIKASRGNRARPNDITPQVTLANRLDHVHDAIIERCRTIRAQHPDRKITILDIGIGALFEYPEYRGITTRRLAQRLIREGLDNIDVIGFDVDLSKLLEAHEEGKCPPGLPPFNLPNLRYIEGDARIDLRLPKDSVDVVICYNVFMHLSFADQALIRRNVSQVRRSDGIFMCD
jgi:SAM-dependent methyltransferase